MIRVVKGDLRIKNVGGGSSIEEIGGDLELGNVGGNCEIRAIAGELQVANIGGNAEVHNIGAVRKLGNVGGNLTLSEASLSTEFAATQPVRIAIGGNLRVELPDQPDLTIRAIVGGRVRAEGIGSHAGSTVSLVYGKGTGSVTLVVGGNLDLHGGGTPQVTGGAWHNLAEISHIGRELGREFAAIGQEIGRAVSESFDERHERSEPVRPAPEASTEQPADTRAQRSAIVRMVAEKRITPEEGVALLQALD
jgi:hypothetical protein